MMHRSRTLLLVLSVFVLQATAARADETAKELLERAFKAHGGYEKLSKLKATTVKGKGTIFLPVAEVSFTSEGAAQLPDKFKSVLSFEVAGNKVTQVQMLVGDKATILLNGAPQELSEKVIKEMKEQIYVEQVTSLVPLREAGYTLTALGESKVDGQPSMGIKITSKGHRDVSIYFDKKTALVVKAAYKAFDPNADKEVMQEQYYRDYKDQDGTKYAAKSVVMQDDKKFMEIEVTEYKSLEKLDNSVFKP
ncbi:hypothetical protein BH10PLA2_BH10PLA2_27380 [soil metagenome]